MNLYALSSFIALIINSAIGIIVWRKASNPTLGRHFAWLSFSISLWIMGCFGQSFFGVRYAYSFDVILYTGVALAPATYLHFLLRYAQLLPSKIKLLLVAYLLSGIFLVINWVPSLRQFLIQDIIPKYSFRCIADPGPLWFLLVSLFVICTVYSIFLLWKTFKNSAGDKKNQAKYFMISYVILISAGAQYFSMVMRINLPPIDNFLTIIYGLLMTYVLINHRLMEINIFIRRAGLLTLIYLLLLALIIPAIILFHEYSSSTQNTPYLMGIEVIILSGVLSLGPVLYAYLVKQSSYFKEDTLSGLTHELKSPLAIIESALDAMQHNKSDPTGKNQIEYVEIMERNLSRVQSNVNDLVIIFGNKNYQSSLNYNIVLVEQMIETIFRMHEDSAMKKSISFEKLISPDVTHINCDPERITQVLSNLLSNALKFTTTGSIQIKVEKDHDNLLFSVIDTGTGIPRGELSSIFDRFYKGQGSQRTAGTGVGLAIAKTWVEAHGGKIWAESEGEGKGTTVMFTLPVH